MTARALAPQLSERQFQATVIAAMYLADWYAAEVEAEAWQP